MTTETPTELQTLTTLRRENGVIERVPEGKQPVIEIEHSDHEYVLSFECRPMPQMRSRKTTDWLWSAWIANRRRLDG
jgi:hypothetical protein